MLFVSIWNSFLVQALVLLLFQYPATLSMGEGPDLFLQSGPFQNFHKFFQVLTWSQQYMWNIAALAQPILKMLVSEQKYKNNLKNREFFATAQVKQEYYFFGLMKQS